MLGIDVKAVNINFKKRKVLDQWFKDGGHESGDKILHIFDAKHTNGRAISDELKQKVRSWYLAPANSRMSPCMADARFAFNPATGKKDLKVQIHWREENFRVLHARFCQEVSTTSQHERRFDGNNRMQLGHLLSQHLLRKTHGRGSPELAYARGGAEPTRQDRLAEL